jgi:hypothetical protein
MVLRGWSTRKGNGVVGMGFVVLKHNLGVCVGSWVGILEKGIWEVFWRGI